MDTDTNGQRSASWTIDVSLLWSTWNSKCVNCTILNKAFQNRRACWPAHQDPTGQLLVLCSFCNCHSNGHWKAHEYVAFYTWNDTYHFCKLGVACTGIARPRLLSCWKKVWIQSVCTESERLSYARHSLLGKVNLIGCYLNMALGIWMLRDDPMWKYYVGTYVMWVLVCLIAYKNKAWLRYPSCSLFLLLTKTLRLFTALKNINKTR